MSNRIIGTFQGDQDGPLLVLIGGMHGNEPAGVKGIDMVLKMLEVEYIRNAKFQFNGNVIGIKGNVPALNANQRYIKRDMNRCWSQEILDQSHGNVPEYQEIREVYQTIQDEVARRSPNEVFVMDLHTTSSDDGIFVIPAVGEKSMDIARELHAPVVLGFDEGMKGTSLHFFNGQHFGVSFTPVVFESGQHTDKLSINRAIAGIINCMRTLKMVRPEDVENVHDSILKKFAQHLPPVVNLVYRHEIKQEDQFIMKPGYVNFSKIDKGDWLADDQNGKVLSPESGRLLMPLYQTQGEDGFFIVKDVNA